MSNKVYFLHIPKTAGTSLSDYLDSNYKTEEIAPGKVWNELLPHFRRRDFINPLAKPLEKFSLLRGHFGYGVWREFKERPQYITMLREPVERVVSWHHHLDSDKVENNSTYKRYYIPPYSFKDVLSDERSLIHTNSQSRYIALDLNIKKMAWNNWKTHLDLYYLESQPEFISHGVEDEQLYEKAIIHLEDFATFGLQEHYRESLIMIANTFGWRPKISNKKLMVKAGRPKKSDLSDETIERISNLNKVDLRIYDYAYKLFWQRYSELVNTKLETSYSVEQIQENSQELTDNLLTKFKK